MNGFYNEVIAILKKNGYSLFRQGKGSHEIWARDGKNGVSVAVTMKSRFTANKILKEAGLKERV